MSFAALAEIYDRINGEAYRPYADMLEEAFKLSDIDVKEVLDLGCGTGGITALLADRGYDMIGLDISPDMLNIARERNYGKNTLLLCQDMCEFELYGTVQAIYSSFDCLNYIVKSKDLKQVFVLARNYLESGGVFIFDVNTAFRYKDVFDGNSFVYEFDDGIFAVWRNAFDEKKGVCEFEIDVFYETEDGLYDRACESQKQKLHTREEITECADGFELVSLTGGKGFDGCAENEKEYYVFKKL
ncbi:MAG: class I SAM-dependent methyltransferase [Clostridia bacterium]|nr:class I SAM-dependent methyltransferase [Clostridia bacterium]